MTKTIWNTDLIERYDLSGPRYTSYPTAPHLSDEFSESDAVLAIGRSAEAGRPLSVYLHIPFCDTLCYYCGCNKVITRKRDMGDRYLDYIIREIRQRAPMFKGQKVEQIHLGGGTPTWLTDEQLTELVHELRDAFDFTFQSVGDFSIEIHPKDVSPERVSRLRTLGFNRLSIGVQDFDPAVQKAVNRFNTELEVQALVNAAKAAGFYSINIDLIYGLPHQTKESFLRTLKTAIAMDVDRFSVFNYAHMPHLFPAQKRIEQKDLPSAEDKLDMFHSAIELLEAHRYVFIGMDHFAKPDDDLALAQRQGLLHRNFQGYTTHEHCDLIAFGISSISQVDSAYWQNFKTLEQYYEAVDAGESAVAKGIILNDDDDLRRAVIKQIICHFELDYAAFEARYDINFAEYFAAELTALQPLLEDGVVELTERGFKVADQGRLLVRRVCMIFDVYLDLSKQRYSKVI